MNEGFQPKVVEKNPNEFLLVSNTINIMSYNKNENQKLFKVEMDKQDIGIDTNDLFEETSFDIEILKQNYLNNMISWQFLRKIADFHQWPLGCIGNFIENSTKAKIETQNIYIDVKVFDKFVYKTEKLENKENLFVNSQIKTNENSERSSKNENSDRIHFSPEFNFTNQILVLTIKDDGCGIKINKFNKLIYSFSVNPNNEYNFFKYGLSLKASALRLGNSFFIISKTVNSVSIGLLSKNLQNKYNSEFIITPIVNYSISDDKKYNPVSNMHYQTLNLIINEMKFMFYSSSDLFNYINSFDKGTHIFVFDLKQHSNNPASINTLSNYELYFDFQNKDIYFNYFKIQIGENHYIDCSLKTYIKFMFLKQPELNIYLMEQKITFINPLASILNISKNLSEILKIPNLKGDFQNANEVIIESQTYKGFIFNELFFETYIKSSIYENNFDEKEVFNGVLLYQNNKLISRFKQNKLGDIYFYVGKFQNKNYIESTNAKIFPISGFIELPSFHEILPNKMEFKDQALYAYFYNKLSNTIKKIGKNKIK